ncbi:hypothetical protein PO902_10140 [Planococcus maritimus]|nr:hypothetical protein [Planococcus sp. SK3692]MDE4085383.1 hypothetical protein [Planococcus maritimus]
MNFAINKGDNTEEFIDSLKEKYPVDQLKKLAEKNLYVCPYCEVYLRVKSGDKRGTYFAHPPNLACVESKQVEASYRQYQKQIQRESFRHPVLVSMIKDELETVAAEKDLIDIKEGYRVSQFTKHFPDLYVKIGSKEWAITVLTDLKEHESKEHSRNFKARHQYFRENGLIPLWLIDKANFATETAKNSIVLWEIEWLSSHISREDVTWKQNIATYTNREELFKVLGYTTTEWNQNREIEMKSIYYISQIGDRNYIRVFRFIDDLKGEIYRGFLIGETSRIPFSQALQIKNEAFMLRNPEQEIAFRGTFKEKFSQEKKRKREKEAREREAREREKAQEKERKIREARERKAMKDREKEIRLRKEEKRKEILQRIQEKERAKKAAVASEVIEDRQNLSGANSYNKALGSTSKKVSVSTASSPEEKELDEKFRRIFYEMNRSRIHNLAQHVPEKKYKDLLERMQTIRIEGASYIKSPNHMWRSIILRWLEENYYLEEWTVSIQMIMDILRNEQVEFIDNRDSILKVPIRDFLVNYQKIIKKELKIKSTFIIVE